MAFPWSLIIKARTRSRCLAISALMQAIIFVIRTSIFIILFTQILILSPALHMPSSKPLKQTMRSPFCMGNNTWTCEPGLPKACGLFQRRLNVFSSASRHYLCLIPAPKRTGIVALCQSECINFFFSLGTSCIYWWSVHLVYPFQNVFVAKRWVGCCSRAGWAFGFCFQDSEKLAAARVPKRIATNKLL